MSVNAHCYKTCEVCGKDFRVKPSHYDRRRSCSKECFKSIKRMQMQGENNHQFGLKAEKNASWQGGRRISNYGYVLIYCPEHARRSDNYAPEHRVIMEKHIGRKLGRYEVVHHINHNKTDNRLENLELMQLCDHTRLHNWDKDVPRDAISGRFFKQGVDSEELL